MSSVKTQEPQTQTPKTNAELALKDRNNFNINVFQYPDDLGGEDIKHWVRFSINVRGKSTIRLANEQIGPQVARSPDSAQLSEEELGQASSLALTVGGAAAGAAAGSIVSSFKGKFTSKNSTTGSGPIASGLKKAAPALIGAAVGKAVSLGNFLKPDTTYKISDVIDLYVDAPPTVRYAAQYSNKDLGTIAGLAAGGVSGVASVEGASAIAMQFAKIPQLAGVNTEDIIGASAKVALNPFKEVLFEAIDFRSFAFKYKFFPKNRQEADRVYEIIERFKFHMHPELSANKLFFIYPSEFEITYYFETSPNNKDGKGYFHKLKPCVLESMDVSYGGEQFSSFRDGKPTEINVSLTFRETEILTKQQIKNGY